MVFRIAAQDILQRVTNQRWDGLEVGHLVTKGPLSYRLRQGEKVRHAHNPSLMGFPICISSRHTDGPFCPMYSLLSSLGGAGSVSAPASVMETSASRETGTKPYEVGIIALGVSSPAYPARSVDVPISRTRAETSSKHVTGQGRVEREVQLKDIPPPYCTILQRVFPIESVRLVLCVETVRMFLIFPARLVFALK